MEKQVEPSTDMLIAEKRENEVTPLDEARRLAIKQQALKAMEEKPNSENKETEQTGDSNTNRAARRLLEKEKKLREAREQFEKDQQAKLQEFESSKSEWETKLSTFESAAQEAKYNPVEYLQSLGLSKEELLDTARVIFFQENQELATDEIKSKIAEIKYRQELKKLENKVETKLQEKQGPSDDQKQLIAYQENIIKSAEAVDANAFPLTAKYIENGADKMEVANAMYAAAQQYATETNGQGAPLTPEQCLERVEKQLKRMQLNEKIDNSEEIEREQESPVIRNKTTKVVSDVDESKLSFSELRARARARANAVLEDRGLFK